MISIQRRKIPGLIALALCGSLLAGGGCSNENATPARGTGGKTGTAGATGSGGASGTGGAIATGGAAPATGGDTGAGTGGNATTTGGAGGSATTTGGAGGDTGTGGAGGSATTGGAGGDTGIGGADATGGAGGMPILLSCGVSHSQATNMVVASDPVISDFTYTGGADAVKADGFSFGDYTDTVSGYGFKDPKQVVVVGTGGAAGGGGNGGAGGAGGKGGSAGAANLGPPGLSEDLTASNWHITGVVNTYSVLFGIGMVCITDASAFAGIEFTIKGNVGPSNQLTLIGSFSGDDPGSRVIPSLGMCEGTCASPSTKITVSSTTRLVQIPWAMFTGGKPMNTVNPAQLTGLRWVFAWSGTTSPYAVDVTVDDLHFLTAAELTDGGTPDASAGN